MKAFGFEDGVRIQKGDFDEWISTCGFRKTNWSKNRVVWGNKRHRNPFARKYMKGAARQAGKINTRNLLSKEF